MTDISHGDAIIGGFHSTSDNVDEMFAKLSIPEIQRLSSQYNSIIATTKDELHSLVSDKYRDLIKIAEDIGDLRSKSLTIEENLQEISYKPSTFVSPYTDSYANFDSILRHQNAAKAQHNSRSVIVRNIIQKRLAKLVNKISCEGRSPIHHTSNFIPFVKELYTIETVFNDVLQEKKDLQQQMHNIKHHLLEYFKHEIAVYNFPLTSFNSNDRFSLRQRFLEKDFTTDPNLKFAEDVSFIDDDDFDEFQDGDDDLDETQEKYERFDKLDTFKNTNYNRNVSALCNYLVCYTILSSDIEKTEAVKHKLIDLRMEYLKMLLSQSIQSQQTVNYRSVFLYLENTCNYLKSYFGDTDSDYLRTLRDVSKPWSLTELVGHKGWIDDVQVEFGRNINSREETPQVSVQDFDKVMAFITELVSGSSESNKTVPTVDVLSASIVKYHDLIMSLKRLDSATKLVGSQSQLVELVSETTLLKEMSVDLENMIKEIYESHISQLMSDKGILGSVRDVLDSASNHKASHNPFDPDVVNLMDYNLGEYMKLVIHSDENSNQSPYNTTYQLSKWLNEYFQLKKITDFDRNAMELSREKQVIYDYLPQLYHSLQGEAIQWGDFTAKSLKGRFQSLYTTVSQSFRDEVAKFCASLLELSLDESDVSKLIYLIGLLTKLRDVIQSKSAEMNQDTKKLIKAMESNTASIFKKVVSQVLDNKIDKLRDLVVLEEPQANEADIPTRPSLELASNLYEIAQIFLTQAAKIEPNNVNLFSNSSTLDHYIKAKNEWLDKVIGTIMSKTSPSEDSPSDSDDKTEAGEEGESTNSNEDTKPSKTTTLLQIAANVAFLQLFCKPNIDAKVIKSIIESIHVTKDQNFNENTLEIISSGVSSFYKSRKNIYQPLSL
ncbi:hypothetical protein CANMA_000977 [Candida margitis]|uniref:uncharacterized protein n=1 Tax=Candida margitis TaxID=1775924 RepID=UPI0022269D8B|nr:uncharacterized protein CANMA_000977 [Candida margitis]KAI5969937.1 hypothetical protein CANMA_000977 [Candida margitis]